MWVIGAELARAAGVTPQTIFNMERQKLVVWRPGKRGGKKEYEVHASVARILADEKTRNKEKVREAYATYCDSRDVQPYWMEDPPRPPGGRTAAPAPPGSPPPASGDEQEDDDDIEDWSLGEAKRRTEIAKAKLAGIQLAKESGRYIEADVARATLEDIGIRTQKAFLAIPDRIAAVLAAEQDTFKVQRLLEDEIRGVLNALAGDLSKANPA